MDPRLLQNTLGRITQVAQQKFGQGFQAARHAVTQDIQRSPIARQIDTISQATSQFVPQTQRPQPTPTRQIQPFQLPKPVTQGIKTVGNILQRSPTLDSFQLPQLPKFINNPLPRNPVDRFVTNTFADIPRSIGRTLSRVDVPFENRSLGEKVEDIGNVAAFLPVSRVSGAFTKQAQYLNRVADKATINKIMDFVIDVQKTGGKRNYGQLGQEIQAIATDVFGPNARNLTNRQLANAFDATLKSIGQTKNRFSLGLAVDDVRQGLSNRMGKNNPLRVRTGKPSIGTQQIPETELNVPTTPSSLSGNSSSGSIAKIPNSENPYFNTNKLNVSPQAKQQVNQVIQEVKPQIEKVVGKKLSNQETINTANNSARILNRVVEREQTADFTARLLRTRQKLAAAANLGTVDKEYIDNLLAIKSHATDIARKLQSFNIGADPKLITSKDAILEAVLKVEKDSDKVIKAAQGVDFNDLRQATDFYRKFIKPTAGEWVDLVRYNSMLSSPNTHLVNAMSNALNSGLVAPVEKTLTGTLDFLGSKLRGKPQTQFATEGPVYVKGYFSNLRNAGHAFADSLRGKIVTGNLDVRQIPLSTKKSVSNLNLPTRLLEATDQFFTRLTRGGEEAALRFRKGKGVNVGNIETKAMENAKYRVFRSELHNERQGTVLNSIDDVTALIQRARSSSNPITSTIAKFTLPFVQTPMNIFKQGIEYSPLGFSTMIKAPNKTEQLSKAILGSSAAAATAMLVTSGRTTWAEPVNPSQKAAFRAAGMQPYSIKIGDKWVSYSKLPPAMAFPIAFITALHDAEKNQTIDENQLNVILNATAKFSNFFADQSYVKNIGDLVAATKGSPEAMARFISNYPQQLVPYRALLGWMARLVDPYQRKVNTDAGFLEKQVQQLFTQIPGLSMTVPARVDQFEQPIPNQNREINAFSPLRVSTERPEGKQLYDMQRQESLLNKNIDAAEKMIEQGKKVDFTGLGQAEAAETAASPMLAGINEKIAKKRLDLTGDTQIYGTKIFYKNIDGGNSTFDLEKAYDVIKMSDSNKYQQALKESAAFKMAQKVLDLPKNAMDDKEKLQLLQNMGLSKEDVEYYQVANDNENLKTLYVLDNIGNITDRNQLYQKLLEYKRTVNNNEILSDGVADNLVDEGILTKEEAKQIKKLKLDSKGNQISKSSTGRKKLKVKKITVPKIKVSKPKKLKIKKVKLPQIKFSEPRGAKNAEKIELKF